MNFLHLGIPTKEKIEGKKYTYVDAIKLHVTNPNEHDYKLQFVCADEDSPLPKIVRENEHLSISVDNIEEAVLDFEEVVFQPVVVNDTLKIAFAVKEGVLFELMEYKN